MTTQAVARPHVADAATDDARLQRLLPLSGVAFVPLFLVGWFVSGGVTPHYSAPDQDWVNWAHDNQWKGRISAFAMLLAAFIFLYFMSVIRGVLAESRVRGSAQLGRVAFGGALVGIAGMAMALVTMAAASSDGAERESRRDEGGRHRCGRALHDRRDGVCGVPDGRGIVTLRTRSSPAGRDRGARRRRLVPDHVPRGPRRNDRRQPVRLRVLPGAVALVTWTAATSIATYRNATTALPAAA